MTTKAKLNKPRAALSITTTLAIAFFILSSVILLINGGIAFYTNFITNRDSIALRQQSIAQDASKTVSSFIQNKLNMLDTAIRLTNPVGASVATQKNMMVSLLAQDPAFRQFALLDSQGQQLSQVSRASQSLSAQYITQVKDDAVTQTSAGQHYISPVYIDDATSEPLIAIAVPVKNVLGDFQGTLVGEVNLKFMWDLVDQLKVGETGYVYVVDNLGNLIAFGDTGRVLANENVGQIITVNKFMKNPGGNPDTTLEFTSYTGLLGKAVMGTYVPLGTPEWAVVTELPNSEALLPIYQLMGNYGTSSLVMAVLAGLAGIFMARRLSAPMIDLSNMATEIVESGNLALQAKVDGPAEIAKVAATFNIMTARLRDLIGSLEQRVADRTKELATVAEVGTAIATVLETDKLLQAVVDLTKERFNLYHSHIYLLDEKGENLVLTAGAGEPGRIMVAEKHSIPLNREQSLVARAAREQKGVTVNDVTQAPDFLPNPLLPDTRSELAVPMIVSGRLIGVFDIQSDTVGRFAESDINIQTTLAAQVSTSIQNVRSFEQSKAQADLETLVNAIGQKIQRTTTVEDTLQTAIREVGLALGASRVTSHITAKKIPNKS